MARDRAGALGAGVGPGAAVDPEDSGAAWDAQVVATEVQAAAQGVGEAVGHKQKRIASAWPT